MMQTFSQRFPRAVRLEGFQGVSNDVYRDNGHCLKLTRRNTAARLRSDYAFYREHFPDIVPASEILTLAEGTVVRQPWLEGRRFADIPCDELAVLLGTPQVSRPLARLLDCFIYNFQERRLYPDLVGVPESNRLQHSINLFVVDGALKLCDIGLSPHLDTLQREGTVRPYAEPHNREYFHTMLAAREALFGPAGCSARGYP